MKIIAFIQARQGDVIRKILEHCGLGQDPPTRAPPNALHAYQPLRQVPNPDSGISYETDPEFLERARQRGARPAGTVLEVLRRPWEED